MTSKKRLAFTAAAVFACAGLVLGLKLAQPPAKPQTPVATAPSGGQQNIVFEGTPVAMPSGNLGAVSNVELRAFAYELSAGVRGMSLDYIRYAQRSYYVDADSDRPRKRTDAEHTTYETRLNAEFNRVFRSLYQNDFLRLQAEFNRRLRNDGSADFAFAGPVSPWLADNAVDHVTELSKDLI